MKLPEGWKQSDVVGYFDFDIEEDDGSVLECRVFYDGRTFACPADAALQSWVQREHIQSDTSHPSAGWDSAERQLRAVAKTFKAEPVVLKPAKPRDTAAADPHIVY